MMPKKVRAIWQYIPSYLILVIFIPLPTQEYFVWPLSFCVLADICNHSWIPECGYNFNTSDRRLFIDECDMYEFNCDNRKAYQVINYTHCFSAKGCPTLASKFYRMGDFQFFLEGRKLVYEPTGAPLDTHKETLFLYQTTVPMLPKHMFKGRRRYTPEVARLRREMARARTTVTKAFSTSSSSSSDTMSLKNTYRPTIELQRMTFLKDGKMMVKVVKGFAKQTKKQKPDSDDSKNSDFLQ